MPLLVDCLLYRHDHILIGTRLVRYMGQLFCHGLAGNGDAIAMQQASVEQNLHYLRNTTGSVQIGRHILTRGFQVTDHRYLLAHALVVIDMPLDISGMRYRQKV